MDITRNTMRADGQTVGQAMDNDAAFLRSIGIPATDGALTFDEQKSDFIEATRNAVLTALDESVKSRKGWIDSDLTDLFKSVDKIAERNFFKSKGLID